jgi:hypothetical protein
MTKHSIAMRLQRQRQLNDALDAYLEWRQQCNAVWNAYSDWAAGRESDAALRYSQYSAALDREERASELYVGLIERATAGVGG